MANDDFARGLWPVNWATDTLPVHVYEINSGGTGGVIFMGQPVALVAAGVVQNSPQVGGTGTAYLGVAVGFLNNAYGPISDTLPYADTSGTTARYAIVADDPNQEFLIQCNTNATSIQRADRGASADMIYRTTSGNTTTGFANLELDGSSVVTTGSGAVTIVRISDNINSDGTLNAGTGGFFTKWVVRITNHQRRGQPVINVNV